MAHACGSVGCEATIAADCSAGPADITTCEADCEALRAGTCGVEYEALLTCGEGEPVTCDGAGIPVVEACAGAQGTFVDCLGGS